MDRSSNGAANSVTIDDRGCALESIEVCWPLVVSRWNDPLGIATPSNGAHIQAAIVLNIAFDDRGARAGARLQSAHSERELLAAQRIEADARHDGRWTHVDARDGDGRLVLSGSFRHDETPGYLRTDLLHAFGITGAICEPPTIKAIFRNDDAAASEDATR